LTPQRKNLLAILLAAALQAVAFGIYETGLPLYLQFIGIPLMSMGLIFGISQVGMLAVRWLAGTGSDTLGRKPFYASALAVSSCAMGLIPASAAPLAIGAVKTARDMAGTMYDAVRPVAVYEESGPRFMKWIGRVDGVIYTFIAVGALSTGWLISALGYRWPFAVAALLGFTAAFVLLRGYRERRRRKSGAAVPVFSDLFRFDLTPALWTIVVSNFILNIGIGTSHSFYLLLFFQDKFGFSVTTLGLIQMLHRLSLGVPIFFAGALMDRRPVRRHYMSIYAASVMAQGLFITGAGLIPGAALATGVFILHDLVGATFWGPINSSLIQSHVRPNQRGSDVALVTGLSGLGWIFGPLLAGWLADTMAWRDGPFVVGGLTSICGGLLMLRLANRRKP